MSDVLFLSRRDVASLLDLDDCIAAVERAFSMLGRGELPPPAIAGLHAAGGAFHIKAAIAGGRFAAKINANFFEAVPRIKGVVVLADAADGTPLAVMDSIDITILRTGAASATGEVVSGCRSAGTRRGLTRGSSRRWATIIRCPPKSRAANWIKPMICAMRRGIFPEAADE